MDEARPLDSNADGVSCVYLTKLPKFYLSCQKYIEAHSSDSSAGASTLALTHGYTNNA